MDNLSRIGAEERKLVMAQRKLESIRILDELISRAKVIFCFLHCDINLFMFH